VDPGVVAVTPAERALRNLWERLTRRFYEGPEAPARLEDVVREFDHRYPRATRAEWAEFAIRMSRGCYRDGWVRGYEWAERDPGQPDPSPEELADQYEPGWRDRTAPSDEEPFGEPFEEDT
jgi:hypothetical protein